MTALWRVASIWRSARRARTAAFQSCMAGLRDAVDGGDEPTPAAALLREHASSLSCETVITAPALTFLLDPLTDDPSAALEAVEQWIERRDLETDGAVGALLDHLADLVAVSRPRLEQRQN